MRQKLRSYLTIKKNYFLQSCLTYWCHPVPFVFLALMTTCGEGEGRGSAFSSLKEPLWTCWLFICLTVLCLTSFQEKHLVQCGLEILVKKLPNRLKLVLYWVWLLFIQLLGAQNVVLVDPTWYMDPECKDQAMSSACIDTSPERDVYPSIVGVGKSSLMDWGSGPSIALCPQQINIFSSILIINTSNLLRMTESATSGFLSLS